MVDTGGCVPGGAQARVGSPTRDRSKRGRACIRASDACHRASVAVVRVRTARGRGRPVAVAVS
eukprot:998070-Pleurochrysis_carterae.AAC.1